MKITNKLGLPQPLVSAVEREYTYKPKQYSVTALLKGTCQAILERRHHEEIEQDVSEMAWLIFGTAVHKVLEEAQETCEQLKENKLVIDLPNGYKISGIFDLYDDATKTVTDWKTASVNKVLFNDWDDYRNQLLIYCWMLKQIGFDANKGELVVFLKDHSKAKAKVQADYPQQPIYKKSFTFKEEDFIGIEKQIIERFEKIDKQELLSDEELEPCSEVERWHRNDSYAVIKKGNKRAMRVLDSMATAEQYKVDNNLDDKYEIVFREGQDAKCDDYCSVNMFCPFYRKKMGL